MEPMTMALIASAASALGGGLQSYLEGRQNKKETNEMRQHYAQMIQMMQDAQNQDLYGLYGASAGKNGVTTGNSLQDDILKLMTQQVQAKELQALAINNAKQNLTDAEARNDMFRKAALANQNENKHILNSAGRNIRRYNQSASDVVGSLAKADEAKRTNMFNQSMFANNNNLANIAAGSNLNTGSIADQNRQQAMALNNAYTSRNDALRNNIISLMQGMPTKAANPLSGALMAGLTGGVKAGTNMMAYNNMLKMLGGG